MGSARRGSNPLAVDAAAASSPPFWRGVQGIPDTCLWAQVAWVRVERRRERCGTPIAEPKQKRAKHPAKHPHSTPQHTAGESILIECNFGCAHFLHWGVFPSVQRHPRTRNRRKRRARGERGEREAQWNTSPFFSLSGAGRPTSDIRRGQAGLSWLVCCAPGRAPWRPECPQVGPATSRQPSNRNCLAFGASREGGTTPKNMMTHNRRNTSSTNKQQQH